MRGGEGEGKIEPVVLHPGIIFLARPDPLSVSLLKIAADHSKDYLTPALYARSAG